jgi:hypothetical protein
MAANSEGLMADWTAEWMVGKMAVEMVDVWAGWMAGLRAAR